MAEYPAIQDVTAGLELRLEIRMHWPDTAGRWDLRLR